MTLALRRTEQRKGDLVVELFEFDFQLHVEFERLRRLRAIDDVAHHARAFVELDHGDGVGRGETRHRTVMDHVAVEFSLAARLEDADLAGSAGRAERARREIDVGAGVAALQAQFARLRAVPEMLGLRRRFWLGAHGFGHDADSSSDSGAGSGLLVPILMRHWTARRQRSSRPLRMPRIPAHALLLRVGCLYGYDVTR